MAECVLSPGTGIGACPFRCGFVTKATARRTKEQPPSVAAGTALRFKILEDHIRDSHSTKKTLEAS